MTEKSTYSGTEYRLVIQGHADVEISNTPDNVILRLIKRSSSEFIVADAESKLIFTILRIRRPPYARFSIILDGQESGAIICKNIFRTRYQITLLNRSTWQFYMPMFSVHFYATSNQADTIKIRMFREDIWGLLFDPGLESQQLIGALAFIFSARWNSYQIGIWCS
ncbi:MAG: hypothetical protein V4805_06380 [Pseudomonadota bacterium]